MRRWITPIRRWLSGHPEPNPADAEQLAEAALGPVGKLLPSAMLVGSADTVKNANVCTDAGKVWFGDLDLANPATRAALTELAGQLGRRLYVLRERDGRWDHENRPRLDGALQVIDPAGDARVL